MQRLKNEVAFSGQLVKNNLKLSTNGQGVENISGNLVLRDSKNSEFIVNVFCDAIKSTRNGSNIQYTGEKNRAFEGLKTILTYQGMDIVPDGNVIISNAKTYGGEDICGYYSCKDYINKDNELVSLYQINASFMTSDTSNIDVNDLKCVLSLNGIIESILPEQSHDGELTGNSIINFLVLNTKGGWATDDAVLDSCYPIKLLLPKRLVENFESCGYYEGCYTNFVAKIVNIEKEEKLVTSMALGDDIVKVLKTVEKYNEIIGATPPTDVSEIGITPDMIDALKNKREYHLEELKKNGYLGNKNSNSGNNLKQNPLYQSTSRFNPMNNNESTQEPSRPTGFGNFGGLGRNNQNMPNNFR